MVKGKRVARYLPGTFGSTEFVQAYEAACEEAQAPLAASSRAKPKTIAWLVAQYQASARWRDLSATRKESLGRLLSWVVDQAGAYHYADLRPRHIEAIMGRKTGPSAQNNVRKALRQLYNYATAKLDFQGPNPAAFADPPKENPNGYHTWTDAEVNRYLARHREGPARLAMLLALLGGMSRNEIATATRAVLADGRLIYRRGKTKQLVDLPILPELGAALADLPTEQMLLLPTAYGRPRSIKALSGAFRGWADAAGCPGSLHGLRKAGARRLAEAGATEKEIAAYLGHKDTKTASIYTKAADAGRLADSGLAKVTRLDQPRKRSGTTAR